MNGILKNPQEDRNMFFTESHFTEKWKTILGCIEKLEILLWVICSSCMGFYRYVGSYWNLGQYFLERWVCGIFGGKAHAINHPPVITIFMGGINHPRVVVVWHGASCIWIFRILAQDRWLPRLLLVFLQYLGPGEEYLNSVLNC